MSIIATKSNGTTDITYELASEQGARKEFINKAAGLTEAERLVVTHNLRPNGAKGTDIHSFVFSKGDVDDTTGQFTLGSVEVILRVPRATAFTETVVKDLCKQAQCLLINTFVSGLYAGVTIEGDYQASSAFYPN
jgi:hypothetical protein